MSGLKFQNKYRIPSARWRSWNYGDEGAYFVTICTKHREHYFGEIVNGQMQLSEIGKIAVDEWLRSPTIRPDMNMDCFVVMPNHIHGIVMIGKNKYNSIGDKGDDVDCRDAMPGVSTAVAELEPEFEMVDKATLMAWFKEIESYPAANHFGPQSKNLASIMRGFKSAITVSAHKSSIPFGWQARFNDHVIRNDTESRRIAYYIEQNPQSWENETLNK